MCHSWKSTVRVNLFMSACVLPGAHKFQNTKIDIKQHYALKNVVKLYDCRCLLENNLNRCTQNEPAKAESLFLSLSMTDYKIHYYAAILLLTKSYSNEYYNKMCRQQNNHKNSSNTTTTISRSVVVYIISSRSFAWGNWNAFITTMTTSTPQEIYDSFFIVIMVLALAFYVDSCIHFIWQYLHHFTQPASKHI